MSAGNWKLATPAMKVVMATAAATTVRRLLRGVLPTNLSFFETENVGQSYNEC